jgi:cytochrome c oxidase subunit 2
VPNLVTPDQFWSAWTFEPLVILSLGTAISLYARGVMCVWARAGKGRVVTYTHTLAFGGGVAALAVALVSPLDSLGGTLLSAHMAQHGLLAGIAPPLLLLSRCGAAFAWGLKELWSVDRITADAWRSAHAAIRAVSTPAVATLLHAAMLWVWHAPTLFGAAVGNDAVHALQHLCFFVPALLFWRSLLGAGSPPRAAVAMVAAFLTFMHTGLLGALLTMAPEPLYPSYFGRPDAWGLTVLQDQQLAGVIMWVPLGLPYLVVGVWLAARVLNVSVRAGMPHAVVLITVSALALAGCEGPQSAIDPAGPAAASIHRLGLVLWIIAALVTLLVSVLMLVPFLRRRERAVNRNLFLWGGGVGLPAVTLSVLVPYIMTVGTEMRAPTASNALSVDVTGYVYWWDVSYRTSGGTGRIATANELRVPVGKPVEVWLHAADVIHSFWVPSLAGKTDMAPGRSTRMVIQADRPGTFRGQCAEYCGAQHSLMAFEVIALPSNEFDAWLARLAQPVPNPADAELRTGRDLFLSLGCGACHTVRGVIAGRLGPDLTQVGARNTIGAGTLRGGVGNIAGWIASAQHLKPGNTMPSYDRLDGPQLRALSAYLASLQ